MPLLEKLALGIHNLFKGKYFCHKRSQFTELDIGDQIGEYGFVPCGASVQLQILQIKGAHVEGH